MKLLLSILYKISFSALISNVILMFGFLFLYVEEQNEFAGLLMMAALFIVSPFLMFLSGFLFDKFLNADCKN